MLLCMATCHGHLLCLQGFILYQVFLTPPSGSSAHPGCTGLGARKIEGNTICFPCKFVELFSPTGGHVAAHCGDVPEHSLEETVCPPLLCPSPEDMLTLDSGEIIWCLERALGIKSSRPLNNPFAAC